jgi:hypothetical protein
MSISPLSIGYSMLQSSSGSSRRQDLTQLGNSLQSGDLQGSQQAFASLEQLQGGQPASSSGSSSSLASSGPATTGIGVTSTPPRSVANDFAALDQALFSGNLSQADAAFAQLQADLQLAKQSESSGGLAPVQVAYPLYSSGGGVESAPPSSTSSPGSMPPGSSILPGSVNLVG